MEKRRGGRRRGGRREEERGRGGGRRRKKGYDFMRYLEILSLKILAGYSSGVKIL